jgi:murein L,D-transpeptidase YcbB/YkuD
MRHRAPSIFHCCRIGLVLLGLLVSGSGFGAVPADEACSGLEPLYGDSAVVATPYGLMPLAIATSPEPFGIPLLQAELDRLRRQLDSGSAPPTLPDGPMLRVGDAHPQVALLRQRLGHEPVSRLPAWRKVEDFDTELAKALVETQRRYGLAEDGILGPRTRQALNRPLSERIVQLQLNIDRWRALRLDPEQRHVLVNLAGYRLDLIAEGQSIAAMKVIIGAPEHPTPRLTGRMRYLVINPWWEIPPELGRRSVVPRQLQDPGYFERVGIEVLSGPDAVRIAPDEADLMAHQRRDREYRLRQAPGPLNPVGRVKFIFPNEHSVYLHDTPDRALFDLPVRSLSAGCVRVQKPLELARWLLAPQGMSANAVAALFSNAVDRTVVLESAVMVHLGYWTAWAEADGKLVLADDVYGLDRLEAGPAPD